MGFTQSDGDDCLWMRAQTKDGKVLQGYDISKRRRRGGASERQKRHFYRDLKEFHKNAKSFEEKYANKLASLMTA